MTGSPLLLALLAVGYALAGVGLSPVLAGLFATPREEARWKWRCLGAGLTIILAVTIARVLPL